MRKSWWATRTLSPDATFFLGDMMDGGRFAMLDSECVHIFHPPVLDPTCFKGMRPITHVSRAYSTQVVSPYPTYLAITTWGKHSRLLL